MGKLKGHPLMEIQLSDLSPDHAPQWIQVLRPGTFYKGDQKVEITKKHISHMAENYKNKVRGVDIALDYAHLNDKEAAAWFKEVVVEDDGSLWAFMEWTPQGTKKVTGKEYRYVSADIDFDYTNNETLKKHGPTLMGAGLTNRPVVKYMQPITLSEDDTKLKENGMDLKEENEMLKKKLSALEEKLKGFKKGDDEKKFAEKLATLSEENKSLKTAVAEAKTKEAAVAKKAEFDVMLSEGKVVEAQRESFSKGDMAEFIKNAADVNLNEQGSDKDPKKENTKQDAADQLIELAEKKAKEDSIEFDEAMESVLRDNPKLSEEHNKVFS